MNLLLLLSALLSALTGVGGSVRQPQLAQAVAMQERAATIVAARRIAVTQRPAQHIATLVVSAVAPVVVATAPAAIEPAWASRRRE